MRRTNFSFFRLLITTITFACILFVSVGLFNVEANDEVIDYVSFGASNTNGFGLRGYYGSDENHEAPWDKANTNFGGYKKCPDGSYPDLIADMIEEAGYTVNHQQLGVSSFRVEELRFFLDDTYKGDAYTDMFVFNIPGYEHRGSVNFLLNGALMEWRNKGFAGTPTSEQLVKVMREVYQDAARNADFITIDVGINNFATYMWNFLYGSMFDSDLSMVIDPELDEMYEACRDVVLDILKSYVGEDSPLLKTFTSFVDTVAYTLVSSCVCFDVVIEKIREMNPDVEIVVLSIQNIMAGIELEIDENTTIPFGNLFGDIVNVANAYFAAGSEYCDEYYFADVRQDGHVEFFIEQLEKYDGNPENITINMEDIFDIHDGTYYLENRVQQAFVKKLASEGNTSLIVDQQYLDENTKVQTFIQGLAKKEIGFDLNNDQKIDLDLIEFVALGRKDELKNIEGYGETLTKLFNEYKRILSTTQDAMLEFTSEIMKIKKFDFESYITGYAAGNTAVSTLLMQNLTESLDKAINDSTYSFILDNEYPDGVLTELTKIAQSINPNATEGTVKAAICMGVRNSIGGMVLTHPSEDGHIEVKNAVVKAVEEKITGPEALSKALNGRLGEYGDEASYVAQAISWFIHRINATDEGEHFNVTEDTKYLALGDSLVTGKGVTKPLTQSYPALLANALGVNNSEQYANFGIDGIRANELHYILNPEAVVDKYYTDKISTYVEKAGGLEALREKVIPLVEEADIITLQVGANNYSNFVVDQLMAYLQGNEMYEMDWDKFSIFSFGELALKLKTEYRDRLYQYLSENGMNIPEETHGMLETLIDIFLYSSIDYVVNMEATMAKIREYNEEAFIVIFGTYNPLKGVYYEVEGSERIELGEMLDGVIDLIDDYLVQLANDYDNCVYVDISETALLVDQYSIISKNFAETTKVVGYDLPLPKFFAYTMTNSFRMLHPNVAGNEYIKNQIMDAISHTVDDTEWVTNKEGRWHACTGCDQKFDFEAHHFEWVIDQNSTEDEYGVKHEECTVCKEKGYEDVLIEKLPHTHKPSDEWTHDETGHWHECKCTEHFDYSEHTYEDSKCSECGYVMPYIKGDTDNNNVVNTSDATHLLYHIIFGDAYQVDQTFDYNNDAKEDTADVTYLLYHIMFGEATYPLN